MKWLCNKVKGWSVTSSCMTVAIVDLFDGPVAESQFPHPVDSTPHARRHTQVGIGGWRLEAVSAEIVIAVSEI